MLTKEFYGLFAWAPAIAVNAVQANAGSSPLISPGPFAIVFRIFTGYLRHEIGPPILGIESRASGLIEQGSANCEPPERIA